jgi:phosphatidylinositol glycan class T
LRLASLSRESVCTENLTPWIKLLPCQQKAGISSLLNTYKIFDGDYHSISIDFSKQCDGDSCYYELKQTLAVVLDPIRTLNSKDWSISTLFDSQMTKLCPFADDTVLSVSLPTYSDVQLTIPMKASTNTDGSKVLSLSENGNLTLTLRNAFKCFGQVG